MAGYNSMNRGYNEQSGVNWGKVGLYSAGGLLAAGAARAGMMKVRNTRAYASGRATVRAGVGAGMGRARGWASQGANWMRGTGLPRARGAMSAGMGYARAGMDWAKANKGNAWSAIKSGWGSAIRPGNLRDRKSVV